jgi:Mn2+/Fe2+ NRAMP family transporter
VDVDTGFWLWTAALPLTMTGWAVDLAALPGGRGSGLLYTVFALLAAVLCAVVVTFLILMRAGYRWARTALAGGGVAVVVYTAMRLFSVNRPPVAAVSSAVAGIAGSVLIAGGIFLLHRRDSQGYFTR